MNEVAKTYCIEYIEHNDDPQFGLFLKGEWGCGKTYFITELLKKYDDPKSHVKSSEILYISLFGVNSPEEIDKKIYQMLHPILSSKQLQFAGAFIRTALKLGVNLDFNNDNKNDASINLGGFEKRKGEKIKVEKFKKRLIIVDDIERTMLEPSQIFGYFSEYITQLKTRIIFIGNEEQVSSHSQDEKDKFFKIKEKTIGMEFSIRPDSKTAISHFLNELKFNEEEQEAIAETCQEVAAILKCNNLRTIRQSFYNLNILLRSIADSLQPDHLAVAIRIFLNLYIQKSLNLLSEKSSVEDAIVGFEKHRLNVKEYQQAKEEESKRNYMYSYIDKYIPLSDCWPDIVFDGNYSKEVVLAAYKRENTVNSPEEMKNLFLLLNTWRELNGDAFKQLIGTVDRELSEGVYVHPGEIMHYYNIMVIFSKWGLVEQSIDDYFKIVTGIVKHHRENIVPIAEWDMLEFSFGGWGYSDNVERFGEVKTLLRSVSEENLGKKLEEELSVMLSRLEVDVKPFCRDILHVNGTGKYYKKPLLKLIDVDRLFLEMQKLPVKDQELIIDCLSERYGQKYSNGEVYKEYYPDFENLIKLHDLYAISEGPILFNPKNLMRNNVANSLKTLVEYFKVKTGQP